MISVALHVDMQADQSTSKENSNAILSSLSFATIATIQSAIERPLLNSFVTS